MIKVGPAGSSGLGNLKGVSKVAEMYLDCMEVEFTYGVRMDLKTAKDVGILAKEKGIILSVHAPYYVNLASDEEEKFVASKKRILDACERAQAMGAQNVTFHAGFYQKRTHENTYQLIKNAETLAGDALSGSHRQIIPVRVFGRALAVEKRNRLWANR
jgi:deoxyribonuclease-4